MFEIIAIGASSGGIHTCCEILGLLPMQFSWPILLVQHILPSQDAAVIAQILNSKSNINVIKAQEGQIIKPKHVYISPANTHMVVTSKKTIHLLQSEKVMYSRPSIDVLFESVANVFRKKAIGIILTGANTDGSEGLATIKKCGGYTIVQNPDTAIMSSMPNSAIEKSKVDTVLSPTEIGNFLKEMWFLTNRGYKYYDK